MSAACSVLSADRSFSIFYVAAFAAAMAMLYVERQASGLADFLVACTRRRRTFSSPAESQRAERRIRDSYDSTTRV